MQDDHHLPKAYYPVLAVTPLNLVPSCKDCNKAKLASLPTNANEETLHPYFDDIDSDRWLFASVQTTAPASLKFFVDPPDHWDVVLAARMHLHFETLGLGDLYAAQGADELLNIRHQLRTIHDTGGAATVRSELLARAESARRACQWLACLCVRGIRRERLVLWWRVQSCLSQDGAFAPTGAYTRRSGERFPSGFYRSRKQEIKRLTGV